MNLKQAQELLKKSSVLEISKLKEISAGKNQKRENEEQ